MKLYRLREVSAMVGVTPDTIRVWEGKKYIPTATRVGLLKSRRWTEEQLEQILQFAKNSGYLGS